MSHRTNDITVLIVSQRQRPDGFGRQPGYIAFVEAEDVFASCSDADMVMIQHSPGDPRVRARRFGGRQIRRFTGSNKPVPTLIPRREQIPFPRKHYDVAVFVGFTVWDLPLLERMSAVRRHADRLLAWFPEAWVSEFDDERVRYESFGILDGIFVGMEAASNEIRTIASCPVNHLPPAVDTTRFAALDPYENRPIDVLGIGRRDPLLHRALLDWSRKANKLYIYDTISGTSVPDANAHRESLGDTYRRTDVALTNFAKYDLPQVNQGDREIPGRLWEGLAGGSVMVGFPPDEDLQRRTVGDEVVIPMPSEPSEAVELIDDVQRRDNGPLRRAHVQLALRHHDWAHRWNEIFTKSELDPPAGLRVRLDRLEGMADSLDNAAGA